MPISKMKQEQKDKKMWKALSEVIPKEQSSLEKGMNAWLKNAKDNNVSLNEKQLKQIFTDSLQPYFLIALIDQKAKIREWLKHRDSRNDIMKEFEEL